MCSVVFIGLLTAFIGDVSSHFGCTVGLLDSVTAISIVAFGTSVPGTDTISHNGFTEKTVELCDGGGTCQKVHGILEES